MKFYEFFTENQTGFFRNFVEIPDGTKLTGVLPLLENEIDYYLCGAEITGIKIVAENDFLQAVDSNFVNYYSKSSFSPFYEICYKKDGTQIFLYTKNIPENSKKYTAKFYKKNFNCCCNFDEFSEIADMVEYRLKQGWKVSIIQN